VRWIWDQFCSCSGRPSPEFLWVREERNGYINVCVCVCVGGGVGLQALVYCNPGTTCDPASSDKGAPVTRQENCWTQFEFGID
jgi:hypothetical protein